MADFMKKIKTATRRIQHGVLETLHVVDASDDSEFEKLLKRFEQEEDSIKRLYKDVTDYLNALKALQASQLKVATDFMAFHETESPFKPAADAYLNAQVKCHEKICAHTIDEVEKHVSKIIEAHVAEFAGIKKLVDKRKRKLTDVDAFAYQYKSYQKKVGAKNYEQELKKKEDDLKQAQAIFDKLNSDITNCFDAYLKAKSVLLNAQLKKLVESQSTFFASGGDQIVKALDPIPRYLGESKSNDEQSIESFTALFNHLNTSLATGSAAFASHELSPPLPPVPGGNNNASYGRPAVPPPGHMGVSPADDSPRQVSLNDSNIKPFRDQHKQMAPSTESELALDEGSAHNRPVAPVAPSVPTAPPVSEPAKYATALYDFAASGPDELDFKAGDQIKILREDASGWWLGSLNDREGIFPSNYTQV